MTKGERSAPRSAAKLVELLTATIAENGANLALEITKGGMQPREAVLMLSAALFCLLEIASPVDKKVLTRIAILTLGGESVDG